MAIKLIEVDMELGRFFLINWKVMALYVYIDKNALTKGQMASQSKSEMARLPRQFFNDNDTVVFSDFFEACKQNLWQ